MVQASFNNEGGVHGVCARHRAVCFGSSGEAVCGMCVRGSVRECVFV